MTEEKPSATPSFRYLYFFVPIVLLTVLLPAVYFFFPSRVTYFLSLLYSVIILFSLFKGHFKDDFYQQLWKGVSLLAVGSSVLLLTFLLHHEGAELLSQSVLFAESQFFYLILVAGLWIYAIIDLVTLMGERHNF